MFNIMTPRRKATHDIILLTLLVVAAPGWGQSTKRPLPSPSSRVIPQPCQDEAPKLTGQKAILIGEGMRHPRRIRDAKIKWPSGAESRAIGGVWVGEALIEADGAIHHVWALRGFITSPPWPELDEAIVAAIKEWRYTPTEVNGRAVPVCMTVTVNTELR